MKPRTQGPLVFGWNDDDRSAIRLLLATMATLAGLVGLFVIFRVVYPESRRINARPQQILLLNPAMPADLALIHQAMDRSFVLLPAEPSAQPASLPTVLPAFKPTIAGFELTVKGLRDGAPRAVAPQLFGADIEVLPEPVAAAPSTATPEPPPSVLRPVISGEVAARAEASQSFPQIPLSDPSRPRFQVAVGPRGQVLLALPLSAADDPGVMKQLHAAVTALRFTPGSEPIQWGQISFRWQQEVQP